jgi:hypothetical protein
VPGPETASRHSSGAHSAPPAAPDTASDVVRWAAFSCVLVPVVLVWFGTSLAGAAGTALGLAAVTGACLVLLRTQAGRLTGFRARARFFSANFCLPRIPWSNDPPTPVRPALKALREARAPYVDWPLTRGALPCTARECNAS